MKKKILFIISVFSLLAIAGGGFLFYAIRHSAAHLNELVMLHQVELMRERLALDIYQVQKDLYSLNSTYPESADAVSNHVDRAESAMEACFDCHHTETVTERLADLQEQIDDYGQAVKEALTLRGEVRQFRDLRDQTVIIGESLIAKLETMIVLTAANLAERTEDSLNDVSRSRNIVILLVVAGPLMVALFGFTTMSRFARPIESLLYAVKRMKIGDLDAPVSGLHDEFAVLATEFNDMAGALRKRMREIEENERRYRLLFESAADAIFILDAEGERPGRIVAANPAAVAMHGYSLEELLTMTIQDLDAPDAAREVPERLRRIMQGEHIKMEMSHVKKDGSVFPVEISAVLFEAGDHRYVLAIDRDITERSRVAETLRRAEQFRTTGELATGLAHEIKNPLAGIRVTMEALAEETYLAEDDRDLLFKVVDEIKRIDGLVKGLLNFARPPQPHFMPTDVNGVLDSAAHLALQDRKPENGGGTIAVRKQFAQGLPVINADPLQLKQVFMNLIINAADAVEEAGTIILETSFDPAICAVTVAVTDTGRGMDAAIRDRIFQPFFTTKTKGTGLGLAISKRLIEEQGGSIFVESDEGRGTTLRLVLPCDGAKGHSES